MKAGAVWLPLLYALLGGPHALSAGQIPKRLGFRGGLDHTARLWYGGAVRGPPGSPNGVSLRSGLSLFPADSDLNSGARPASMRS